MTLYQRQLDLEEEYSTASLVAGQQQILDAFKQGRAVDVGSGRLLLARAFEAALEHFNAMLAIPSRAIQGKYKVLLRSAKSDVIVMAALREVINCCASTEPMIMQDVLRTIGRVIESESMLECMDKVSEKYTERTVEYLDRAGTSSVNHRYRTFLAGAKAMNIDWKAWTSEERIGAARLTLISIYESTGLFKWKTNMYSSGDSMYYLEPSEELAKHFQEVLGAARAVVKYPPMLIKPVRWAGQFEGGYLTDWFRHYAPMCGIRYIKRSHRDWIIEQLSAPSASDVRNAMNTAQEVPYRVNKEVLSVLRKAVTLRTGILGLPSFVELPKPSFPLAEGWQKDEATTEELDEFRLWKNKMAAWYTAENKRKGRHTGILLKMNSLVRYQDEAELYFPTFIDWRGRLYFRSNLNPQSSDAVKGCLEFAKGKRLGERGLFWLKVHVANCCGYDKHDAEIKAKWVDENLEFILNFVTNPLDVDAPEADTAFTLLQAGLALKEALELDNPEDYVCHVPVAMDATCSGLQHLSALTRDPIGAYYTNLIDNKSDQKSDIYKGVAEVADKSKAQLCEAKDEVLTAVLQNFWSNLEITRSMAKKPVMTFVYGSTLLSTLDTLALEMSAIGIEPIKDDAGKTLFSLNQLAVPVGKALRKGVLETVPESAKIMKYLQGVVRAYKDTCMRWVTPVGVPVVNWAEGTVTKRLFIRSMGIVAITMTSNNNEYNTRSAANGIVPNFVHSMDSAHLCKTILDFDGDVLPIHDSFATHPSDVDGLHQSLRKTFVDMYNDFDLVRDLLAFNEVDTVEHKVPLQGTLDLNCVLDARYMFC